MTRDIITNKWIIGAIVFLIVFAGACVLWYRYDTAPYRQEAAEAAKLLRQREATQKADTENAVKRAADAPAESSTPPAEQPIVDEESIPQNADMDNTTQVDIKHEGGTRTITIDKTVHPYMLESPFGFGAYPEIPPGWPGFAIWMTVKEAYDTFPSDTKRDNELMARVTIKAWNEGDRNWTHANMDRLTGKVYLMYPNTVYITVKDHVLEDGTVIQRITRQLGKAPTDVDLLNPPSHITVLDYDSSGIDPYEYLNLN